MSTDRSPSLPRQPPTSGFEVLEQDYLLDEETLPWYSPAAFYPVRIGEIFHSKYQVLGKLGFGSVSTAWLCRDLVSHTFVTLKVFISNNRQALNEERVYKHLDSIKTDHPGFKGIRFLRDSFQLPGTKGPHECLVHDPLAVTLKDIREVIEGGKISQELLIKPFIKSLLMALDYLHTEAHVVHTDIQEANVMLGSEDDSVFEAFVAEEWSEPSLRKIDGDRIIYASRGVEIPDNPSSYVVLCDFGDAQFGQTTYQGEVMPDLYRAPEMILGIPWDEKIDIWCVRLMAWDLFEGKHLFTKNLPSRDASAPAHLARMIEILGPPPADLLERGTITSSFFDENNTLLGDIVVQETSLESEEKTLEEGEEKTSFLKFLRRMLRWRPEDRDSASELMKDPWLKLQV